MAEENDFERRKAAFYQACENEDHDAAIREGEALKRRFPKEFDANVGLIENLAVAYHNRGFAYADKGDFDKAIAGYTKVIKLKPNYAEVYIGRGNVYLDEYAYDRAFIDFDKAIELNPDDAEA